VRRQRSVYATTLLRLLNDLGVKTKSQDWVYAYEHPM